MSREKNITINTAQPTDALTAQPTSRRLLTETVQPQGSTEPAEVPLLISGVAAPQREASLRTQPAVPAAEDAPKNNS